MKARPSIRTIRDSLLAGAAIGALTIFVPPALANPLGPSIPSAIATPPSITGTGTANVEITLGQKRTIIDWQSFNIAQRENTKFVFGDKNWIVLNRIAAVSGPNSATIDGNLQGCLSSACVTYGGNIWIYAPGGVIFGSHARVTTGGMLATTSPLSMTDSAFAASADNTKFTFGAAASGTSVAIQADATDAAQIKGNNGTLAFIAPKVTSDTGTSVTNTDGKGQVLYGAASAYNVQFAPNATNDLDLYNFEVSSEAVGSDSTTPIDIKGATQAGKVYVAAVTRSAVANAILSVSGPVTAVQDTASGNGGDFTLSAGGGIALDAQGTPIPAAPIGSAIQTTLGGAIKAENIKLYSNGKLNAAAATITGDTGSSTPNFSGATIGGADISNAGNRLFGTGGFTNSGGGQLSITSSTGFIVSNAITNTVGKTTLTVSGDLTIEGNSGINANGQTLQLNVSGRIVEGIIPPPPGSGFPPSSGAITAGILMGHAGTGVDLRGYYYNSGGLTGGPNSIATLGDFSVASGNFYLTNKTALNISGAVAAPGHVFVEVAAPVTLNGSLTSSGGNLVSLASSSLSLGANAAVTAGTFEYTTYSGTTTLGPGGQLPNGNFFTGNSFVIGAVTDPDANTLTGIATSVAITGFDAGGRNMGIYTGPITQSGALTNVGTLSGNATTVSLTNAGNTISILDGFTVGDSTALLNNGFSLTVSNALTAKNISDIGGPISINTGPNYALTAGDITSGGVVNGIFVSGAVTLEGQSINLTGDITGKFNVGLQASGAITQTGGIISTDVLFGSSGTSASLTKANAVTTLSSFIAGTSLFFNDNAPSLSASNVKAQAGPLGITNSGELYVDSLSASGNISLTGASIYLDGNVATPTTVTLKATAGDILQSSNSAITADVLTGSAAGNAAINSDGDFGSYTGGNKINTLSDFTVGGQLGLANQQTFSANNVQAGAALLLGAFEGGDLVAKAITGGTYISLISANSLTIAGDITTTNAVSNISMDAVHGAIKQTAGIITTPDLGGGAAGSASFTGANMVGDFESFSAADIRFNNAKYFSVSDLSATSGGITLTGPSFAINGDVTTPTTLTLTATAGDIIQYVGSSTTSKSITAELVTGSSTGDTNLNGTGFSGIQALFPSQNQISRVSDFTAGGIFQIASNRSLAATHVVAQGVSQDPYSYRISIVTTAGDLSVGGISSADDMYIASAGSLTLAGNVTAQGIVYPVIFQANGDITQTGGFVSMPTLSIQSGGSISMTGPNQVGQISSLTAANSAVFNNAQALSVTFAQATAGDLSISAAGALTTGSVSGAAVSLTGSALTLTDDITGTTSVNLGATAGDITQSGGVITTPLLTGAATGAVSLANANQVGSLSGFTAGGNALFNDIPALTLGDFDGGGNLTVTAPTITLTGNIMAGATANLTATAGDVTQTGGGITAAILTGSATGSASFAGTNHVASLPSFVVGGDFLFNNVQALTVGSFDPGDLTFSATDLTLTGDLATSGTLTLIATAGNITQTGGIITADTLTGSSSGTTSLGNKNLINTVSNFVSGGFSIANGQDLTVTNVQGAGQIESDGTLTVSGITGGINLNASHIVLAGDVSAPNVLFLNANDVTQTGGAITAKYLAGTVTGSVHLDGANKVQNFDALSAGADITFHNAQDLVIDDFAQATAGTLSISSDGTLTVRNTLSQKEVYGGKAVVLSGHDIVLDGSVASGGTLSLTATAGAITQTSGILTAATLSGSSVSSTTLMDGNKIATLSAFTAGTDFAFATAQALTVSGVKATSGNLVIGSAGALTVGTGTSLSAGGALSLSGASITLNGTLNSGTTVSLTATAGDITQFDGSAITADLLTGSSTGDTLLDLNFASTTNQVNRLSNFTAGGYFQFHNNKSLDASHVTANGVSSDTGSYRISIVTTAGDLTVSDISSAYDMNIVSAGSLTLAGNLVSSGVTTYPVIFQANGIITQTGGFVSMPMLSVRSNTGTVSMTGANQVGQLSNLTATGDALFNNAQALSVTTANSLTGNLSISSASALTTETLSGAAVNLTGSAITLTGDVTASSVASLVSTAGDISQSAGTITAPHLTGTSRGGTNLTGAGNQIAELDAFNAGTGFTLNDARALTIAGTASPQGTPGINAGSGNLLITLTGQGNSLVLTSDNANLTAGATGGGQSITLNAPQDIIQNGGTVTAGTVTLVANRDPAQGTIGNILIGSKPFTDGAAAASSADIDDLAKASQFFGTIAPPHSNQVYIAAGTLNLTTAGKIVSENTGTQFGEAGLYNPQGIQLHPSNAGATALLISGGPSAVALFGTATNVPARTIAASGTAGLDANTPQSKDYSFNGCVVKDPTSCTAVNLAGTLQVNAETSQDSQLDPVVFVSPIPQVRLQVAPSSSRDNDDQLDLFITGAGNDELWQEIE